MGTVSSMKSVDFLSTDLLTIPLHSTLLVYVTDERYTHIQTELRNTVISTINLTTKYYIESSSSNTLTS